MLASSMLVSTESADAECGNAVTEAAIDINLYRGSPAHWRFAPDLSIPDWNAFDGILQDLDDGAPSIPV
jgi:hypothetical protein